MLNRLLSLYPNSIVSQTQNSDTSFVWLKDEIENVYIGIPQSDISKPELKLLQALFPPKDESTFSKMVLSSNAKEWQHFLLSSGSEPTFENNMRFIHYAIANVRDEFQFEEWSEAISSLFNDEVIIVPLAPYRGVIIENHTAVSITEEEISSAIQAFESDFFIKIYFFIGQFQTKSIELRSLYQLEQKFLNLSLSEHPEERIITREKLIPLYLYKQFTKEERTLLFADVQALLKDDPELAKTVRTYIENQSNATLTAKQLFMHRNSLQYRIDKFIEKTGIDIKSFHGAIFAYLACLHVKSH